MKMWPFHVWFVPLIVFTLVWLLRKRQYRDAVLFLFPTLLGYVLWIGVLNRRPFIITIWLGHILEAVKHSIGLS